MGVLLLAPPLAVVAQNRVRARVAPGQVVPGQITIQNETTTLVVNGGLPGNGLVPYGGLFRYHDHSHENEETTWSVDPVLITNQGVRVLSMRDRGGFGSPTRIDDSTVRCQANVQGIEVSVDIELVGTNARQTFRFRSPTSLTGATFLYYAENDLFGHANDIASYTGLLDDGSLKLYMYDSAAGGLSVKLWGEGVKDAQLSMFGAGLWTAWGKSLETGRLRGLSKDGRNFRRLGDLGLALAFRLEGHAPVVVINYDSQERPPYDPKSLRLLKMYDRYEAGVDYDSSDQYDRADYPPSRVLRIGDDQDDTKEQATETARETMTERPGQPAQPKSDVYSRKTWKLSNGREYQGRFRSINGRNVTIMLDSGETQRLPVSRLAEQERAAVAHLLDR